MKQILMHEAAVDIYPGVELTVHYGRPARHLALCSRRCRTARATAATAVQSPQVRRRLQLP